MKLYTVKNDIASDKKIVLDDMILNKHDFPWLDEATLAVLFVNSPHELIELFFLLQVVVLFGNPPNGFTMADFVNDLFHLILAKQTATTITAKRGSR